MAKKISNQLESLASLTSSTNRIGTLGVTVAMRTQPGIGSRFIYTILRLNNWIPQRDGGNANN